MKKSSVGSFARRALALSSLAFLCALSADALAAEVSETPLVRGIYETPIPGDPRALRDRAEDLEQVGRTEDAKLLSTYVHRAQIQLMLGQTPRSAATVRELLQLERNSPVGEAELIERLLSKLEINVDPTPEPIPFAHGRDFEKWEYPGHAVWTNQPERGWLRLAVVNHTNRRVNLYSVSVAIETPDGRVDGLSCVPSHDRRMHGEGETGFELCDASHARLPNGNFVNATALVELMKQVESGFAKVSARAYAIYFPDEGIGVKREGIEPYIEYSSHKRVYPPLGQVTCEDRNSCEQDREAAEQKREAERQRQLERMILNPVTLALVLVVLAFVIAHFSPVAARTLGIVAVIGGVVAALGVATAPGLEIIVYIVAAGGGLVFGTALLLASFIVGRARRQHKAGDANNGDTEAT